MNKLILLIYLGLISGSSFGQKCNVQVDPFTKTKVVSYEFGKYIIFNVENDEVYLRYQFQFDGVFNEKIPEGSMVSFLLKNGSLVELLSLKDANPILISGSTQSFTSDIVTEYFVTMKLTKEQLKALAGSPMNQVRYPDLKGGYTMDDKSKRWIKKLIEGAQCIDNHL